MSVKQIVKNAKRINVLNVNNQDTFCIKILPVNHVQTIVKIVTIKIHVINV